MTIALSWLVGLTASLPVLWLATELMLGARALPGPLPPGAAPPFAVLIPAHDEAAVIAGTVSAVRAALRPCDRVLVVADHCRDATAELARRADATVVERDGSPDRGKGHALAFGRTALCRDPRGVVIVLDADCRPVPGALARLALVAAQRGAAVQGAYRLVPPPGASAMVRVSCFAFLLKNGPRQAALQRLSGRALLQGSGMAFPWPVFESMPLASSSLVEDLELGLRLLLRGRTVAFDAGAVIESPAASQAATVGQRRRWEHGATATGLRYAPRLLAAGLSGRPGLLAVAADLLVPPTVALATAASIAWILLLAAGGLSAPTLVLGASLGLLGAALLRAWLALGREMLPARMLLHLLGYFWWKLPIAARFFFRRETAWVRTSREP